MYNIIYKFPIHMLFLLAACGSHDRIEIDLNREEYRTWSTYLGDKEGTQYSALDQINRDNVHTLEVAWTYSTGDTLPNGRTTIQSNPIVIDGILHGTTPLLKAFAIKSDTGEELWTFDPFEGEEPAARGVNRGFAYWTDGEGDRRLYYVARYHLYSVNADTGELIEEFGDGGAVDFRMGLGRDMSDRHVTYTSPGIVHNDLLIKGLTTTEHMDGAPGHIRAYDVRTGEIVWRFNTIPEPGEYGYETWPPSAWTYSGGANNWAGMSLDEERGIVYIPTGSPTFDFYGGNRLGKNLFGNTLLALDAASGERIWHYQIVRHDLWDYDLSTPPNLVTIRRNGKLVDAVVQLTKHGFAFVFDRETGEPLFPIEEMDAPPSDLPGEKAWSTQPAPVKPEPFARQIFTEEDLAKLSPESHAAILEEFQTLRSNYRLWEPPSLDDTVIFPGLNGGALWGGAAFDPETGVLYINSTDLAVIVTMIEVDHGETAIPPGERIYTVHCAVCHGSDRAGDVAGEFPSLLHLEETYSDQQIGDIIRDGQGIMPSFGHFSDEDIASLVAYLNGVETVSESDDSSEVLNVMDDPINLPFARVTRRFRDPEGYPANKPPWGTLNAIDLHTGDYLWSIPFGEFKELTERGIPITGTENFGGPVVTAGGLLFIGATQDEKFRAYDKTTGEVLWETVLPAGGYATPAIYEIDGKQYVVIAAGGGRGTKSGDSFIAFSLPE